MPVSKGRKKKKHKAVARKRETFDDEKIYVNFPDDTPPEIVEKKKQELREALGDRVVFNADESEGWKPL